MSIPKTYIGIDNGLSGAVAVLIDGCEPVVNKMPVLEAGKQRMIDILAVDKLIEKARVTMIGIDIVMRPLHVVFELSQVIPTNGSKTHFTQGFCFGALSTLMRIKGYPATAIRPKDWMKEMHLGVRGAGEDTKTASIEAVRRLFPGVSLLPTPRCTKPDDGMAEALLMAAWGQRHNL